jgi:hypothetical protein
VYHLAGRASIAGPTTKLRENPAAPGIIAAFQEEIRE